MQRRTFISISLLVVLASTLLIGIALHRQSAQASSSRLSIIGGAIISHQPSHLTITTTPETGIALRIFYRCPAVTRIVYTNAHSNVLGRYTWAWTQGAPCTTGTATAIVTAYQARHVMTVQRTLTIAPAQYSATITSAYFSSMFVAGQQNHVTIAAPVGSDVGMHIIYICTVPSITIDAGVWASRAIYTGTYTWNLQGYAPCQQGVVQVTILGQVGAQGLADQQVFTIVTLPTLTPGATPIATALPTV